MKQIVISLVAVVFLTVPVLAGEIDGSGKQPPPPPPPTSDATTSESPTETVILEVFLLLTSILP